MKFAVHKQDGNWSFSFGTGVNDLVGDSTFVCDLVTTTTENEIQCDLIVVDEVTQSCTYNQTEHDNRMSALAITYIEKRKAEYPAIGDQLDALFHAGVFPVEMADQIQAVKNQYPKG